ncbi:glycosyltransferase family 2 protein [Flavobacterium cellulosilyticum]|uniref:Glycosyltransferase family 2 protein n=1 Tax=Flavobacterium cellulosilyticum TaxID=2541731 RepID=A0A4R5CJA1_9FLAO|nr:glycosyltransferase [Flavobacterium cellulosilyticum]TDD98403.1 glycosyltransferase family 2 protein [Flavobacterium cellulosilyticum]
MQASILIVSKNRKEELEFTLTVLARVIDLSVHEVLVFLDGCTDDSSILENNIIWVRWYSSEKSIGASAARYQLYPMAQGEILFGFDDDAHPLNADFIDKTIRLFDSHSNVGIIAFQEVKGIYALDAEALALTQSPDEEYYTNEFIGCGFSIRKKVYESTNGFPVWIDIYGEESCVALEVIAKGYDILYSNTIKVNHRVNKELRKISGKNYFRFGNQLKNTTYYYLVYYPFPIVKIFKLYLHNFKKYALTDVTFFKIFFQTILEAIWYLPKIMRYRKPVDNAILKNMGQLKNLEF